MSHDEKLYLKKLPKFVTIHRGMTEEEFELGKYGVSWSLKKKVAECMESSSEPQRINISEDTFNYVKDRFKCEPRGEVEIKHGKKVKMYYVNFDKSNDHMDSQKFS